MVYSPYGGDTMGFIQLLFEEPIAIICLLFAVLALPIYHIFLKPIELKRRKEYCDRIKNAELISHLQRRVSELESKVDNN